jgi:hypothetical protein
MSSIESSSRMWSRSVVRSRRSSFAERGDERALNGDGGLRLTAESCGSTGRERVEQRSSSTGVAARSARRVLPASRAATTRNHRRSAPRPVYCASSGPRPA